KMGSSLLLELVWGYKINFKQFAKILGIKINWKKIKQLDIEKSNKKLKKILNKHETEIESWMFDKKPFVMYKLEHNDDPPIKDYRDLKFIFGIYVKQLCDTEEGSY